MLPLMFALALKAVLALTLAWVLLRVVDPGAGLLVLLLLGVTALVITGGGVWGPGLTGEVECVE